MKKIVFTLILLLPIFNCTMEIQQRAIIEQNNPGATWRAQFIEEHIFPSLIGQPAEFKKADYHFLRAAYFKDLDGVRKELQAGAFINVQGKSKNTALHMALGTGSLNYDLVFFLLDHPGIDVNLRDVSNHSPFNFACQSLAHDYTDQEKDYCYRLFTKLLQKAIVTTGDKQAIPWKLIERRCHDHAVFKALIDQHGHKATLNPSAALIMSK